MIERSKKDYLLFLKSHWRYYLELEQEFLNTRKYVEFHELNNATYSIEFLKLYLAVCSEIDVLGKILAERYDSSFRFDERNSNIHRWWFCIQDTAKLTEAPFTRNNNSADPVRIPIYDYTCYIGDTIHLKPWENYFVEQYYDKSDRCRYRLRSGSYSPEWWRSYNEVKHRRAGLNTAERDNYQMANFGNLCNALSALYILEKAFIDNVGTEEDLNTFNEFSELFIVKRRLTKEETEMVIRSKFK